MLFDPLEEQLRLPAAAVQLGDSQSGQGKVVGQKHQSLVGGSIEETDVPDSRSEDWWGGGNYTRRGSP